MSTSTQLLGAWSPARLPDENVEAITALIRPVVEALNPEAVKTFKAIMYTSQLVAGMNYIIKVQVQPENPYGCYHLHIFQPLPSQDIPVSYQLKEIVKDQSLGSPIVPLTQIVPPTEPRPPMPGAPTPPRLPDANVDGLTYQMKPAVEAYTGRRYPQFKAIMYTTQVVAGTNYSIKIQVDPLVPLSCIIINVFQPLPPKDPQVAYQLSGVQTEVPLDYDMTPIKP